MLDVLIGLVPVVFASLWFFGLSAALVLASATAGAVVTEWLVSRGAKSESPLRDNSALLTGVILGLTLPPGVPLWIAFLGGVVAIGLGKAVFGGLGQNLFNPALIGRAFLQAAFPTVMTTWSAQGGMLEIRSSNFAAPFMHVDAITTATPLGAMKFDGEATAAMDLLLGNVNGSLGETSALVIILCGIVLAIRRTFDWRLPVSLLLTVFVVSGALWLIDSASYPSPVFMVLSGGLLFGAVYMATDPVTCPVTPRGAWMFGIGVGILVVLIRLFGGLPEGVMYAILLMNAATPLIERINQPRALGRTAQGQPAS
jgi:electron transport complex protein RnfD